MGHSMGPALAAELVACLARYQAPSLQLRSRVTVGAIVLVITVGVPLLAGYRARHMKSRHVSPVWTIAQAIGIDMLFASMVCILVPMTDWWPAVSSGHGGFWVLILGMALLFVGMLTTACAKALEPTGTAQ